MGAVFYTAMAQVEVVETQEAVREAVHRCLQQLEGRRAGVVLLYASVDLEHPAILEAIQAQWPGVPLIGGTTDGEFSSTGGYTEDSFTLVILGSESVSFRVGMLDLGQPLAPQCREALAAPGPSPSLGILLADGLSYAAEDALVALQDAFGAELPWLGGTTADRWKFSGNLQFFGSRVLCGAAVYLLLCGSFRYGFGVDTGWKPVGPTGVVTRSIKNVVHEIDGRPAMAFYRRLMGEGALPSVDTPTAVYDPCDSYLFLRTSILPLDPSLSSICYSAGVPEGSRVRVTLVDRDSIIEAVRRSVCRAKGMFGGGDPPDLALCFSCAARRAILGSRTADEVGTACATLGSAVPVAGFYSYGEIAPLEPGTPSLFQNEAFVSLLLG